MLAHLAVLLLFATSEPSSELTAATALPASSSRGSSTLPSRTATAATSDDEAAGSATVPPPPLPGLEVDNFSSTGLAATYGSAYLSNGVIGLRVGPNPLQANSTQGMVCGGNALVGGFNWRWADNSGHMTLAPAAYPFETAVIVDGFAMNTHPELTTVLSQKLDTATGELTTQLRFRSPPAAAQAFVAELTVTMFLSRGVPTAAAMRVNVTVSPASSVVEIRPALSTTDSSGLHNWQVACEAHHHVDPPIVLDNISTWRNRSKPWPWQLGVDGLEDLIALQHHSATPVSSLGVAVHVSRARPTPDQLEYTVVAGMVSSGYDDDPTEAAVRTALSAAVRVGWERLRAENTAAWSRLWDGCATTRNHLIT
jgi:trehalose/maltose hydrolase-like predicted phosphorylase